MESRLHEPAGRGPAALQLPAKRRAARNCGRSFRRMGSAGRRKARHRTCAATSRAISFRPARKLYASTGDKDAKAKADYLVAELAKCQEKLGRRISERLSHGAVRPAGLALRPGAARRSGDRPAGSSEARRADTAVGAVLHHPQDHGRACSTCTRWPATSRRSRWREGMADWADQWSGVEDRRAHAADSERRSSAAWRRSLYNLAAITNDDRWAKAGDRFTKKRFMNPLASRRDELRGLHVNTHIPQVIGAARRYEISGDTRFHDVADFFWYEVVDAPLLCDRRHQQRRKLAGAAAATGRRIEDAAWRTAECCCAYNMLKLTRHLYGWTGDPRYFDYYERVLLNHRIGHHPAGDRPHAVLPLADAGRVEDLQHRGPVVLVLHGHGRGGVLQAQRQHLLARSRRRVCEPVHSVGAELGGEGLPAAAGDEVSRAARAPPGGNGRKAGADGDAAARAGMAASRRPW